MSDRQPSPSFEKQREAPYAFIQWKGTDACMDVYCRCGEQFHFDGEFAYHFRCGVCGQVYECDPHITLHPLDHDPGNAITLRDEEMQ